MHVNGRHLVVEDAGTGPAVMFLHALGVGPAVIVGHSMGTLGAPGPGRPSPG